MDLPQIYYMCMNTVHEYASNVSIQDSYVHIAWTPDVNKAQPISAQLKEVIESKAPKLIFLPFYR